MNKKYATTDIAIGFWVDELSMFYEDKNIEIFKYNMENNINNWLENYGKCYLSTESKDSTILLGSCIDAKIDSRLLKDIKMKVTRRKVIVKKDNKKFVLYPIKNNEKQLKKTIK